MTKWLRLLLATIPLCLLGGTIQFPTAGGGGGVLTGTLPLAACTLALDGTVYAVNNAATATDCTTGGPANISNLCICDGSATTWVVAGDGTAAGGQAVTLEIDSVVQSTDLERIQINGTDTNTIFTSVGADYLEINVDDDWPGADEADALAADPNDCASNEFANAIDTGGHLTCAALVDADVPDDITIDLAATATALAADPNDCAAGEIPLGVTAGGHAYGCYEPTEADISDLAHTATAITDGIVVEADLSEASGTPTAGDVLTYNDANTPFNWEAQSTLAAGTAAALAADPNDCAANEFADAIDTGGHLTCNAIVDADVPDDITIDLAATATALAADPNNCAAGEIPLGVAAAGHAQGCYEPAAADISDLHASTDITADLEEEAHCSEHDSADIDCSGETIVYAANSVNQDELAATIALADGDYLNLAAVDPNSGVGTLTAKGFRFPQGADCSGMVTEGQACWDVDADALSIGTSVGVVSLGTGAGDITEVFGCTETGTCGDTITLGNEDLLDMSAVDPNEASPTTRGLILPQGVNCATMTTDGQICFDTDDEVLHVGKTGGTITLASGGGDIITVGDCTGAEDGTCFTDSGYGTTLKTDTDFIVELDDNADGSESFQIAADGDPNSVIFEVTEAGAVTAQSITDTDDALWTIPATGAAEFVSVGDKPGSDWAISDAGAATFQSVGDVGATSWDITSVGAATFASTGAFGGDITMNEGNPSIIFEDSGMGGTEDDHALITVNCPTGTTATSDEDCDMSFLVDANGVLQTALKLDTPDTDNPRVQLGDVANNYVMVDWTGNMTFVGTAKVTAGDGEAVIHGNNITAATLPGTALAWDLIDPNHMGDFDHGDVAWSSGVATVQNVNCADCIDPNEVADVYVLNAGDTITGTLTLDSGGLLVTDDDQGVDFGDGQDWTLEYDESADDQLLLHTAKDNASGTGDDEDPLFQILVAADDPNSEISVDDDQQVFGIAKGTQASNTDLLTLDEDGDLVIGGDFTQGRSNEPQIQFNDAQASDGGDINARIWANCTVAVDGSEDCDMRFSQQIGGAVVGSDNSTIRMFFDADGASYIDTLGQSFEIGDQGAPTVVTITDLGALTAAADITATGDLIASDSDLTLNATGVKLTGATGDLTIAGLGGGQNENLIFNFNDTANTVEITSGTGVTDVDFMTINLATDALDLSDGDIDNVGQLSLDKMDAVNGTGDLDIGDGDEVISISSSDWAIDDTGAMTGIGAITADGSLTLDNGTGDTPLLIIDNKTVAYSFGAESANDDLEVLINETTTENVILNNSGSGALDLVLADGSITLTEGGITASSGTVAAGTLTEGGVAVYNDDEMDEFSELDAIVTDKELVNKADGAVWLGAHDFGGADSVELPQSDTPTTNATGECAIDTNGDGSTVTTDTFQCYDGAANYYVFGVREYPTTDGQIIKYNSSNNDLEWATDATAGSPTFDTIGDAAAASTIAFDDTETVVFQTAQNTAGSFFKIDNTVADVTNAVWLLDLEYTDDGQANANFLKMSDNNGDVKFAIEEEGQVTAGQWLGTPISTTYGGTGADTSGWVDSLFGLNAGAMTDIDTEAELEIALEDLDVVTVTTDDISTANLMTILSDEGVAGTVLHGDGTWSTVDTGEYGAASIDGDDVNSSIAGRSLTLTVASPDTLDADEELYRDECNVTIEDATTADDIMCGKATGNLTLTSFDCVGIGGSPSALVMEVRECTNAGATCADMGAQVTVAAVETNYSDTSFTDSAIDDGDWWQIAVISVTTAPTYVHCQAEFTRND